MRTVFCVVDDQVALLRPGNITVEDIEKITKTQVIISADNNEAPLSPGQLKSHYAPETKLILNVIQPKSNQCLLGFGQIEIDQDTYLLNLSPSGDLTEAAANLFSMLRTLDQMNFSSIAVSPIPHTGLGLAINDRLKRAAASKDEI